MLTRRTFLTTLAGSAAHAGCQSPTMDDPFALGFNNPFAFRPVKQLGTPESERFPIPHVDLSRIDRRYHRQYVDYDGPHRPGTIGVDTGDRFLYLVGSRDNTIRYGIGVGRQGLSWSGRATVRRKAAWPRWTPTRDMIARDPQLQRWAGGMEPGPGNPLGARALYLYEGGVDTLYRLHGTNEPWSIGQAVSSGCVRLLNIDIIDLYERVPIGTEVVVLQPRPLLFF
jgi:lipoprotein-anchoring transpeptidase ErfK/SrfK